MAQARRSWAEVIRTIRESQDAGLPDVVRTLRLKTPDSIDPVLRELGMDRSAFSDGDAHVESLMNYVFFVTIAYDISTPSNRYDLTRKTWALLGAAREKNGTNGVNKALRGIIEVMGDRPYGFQYVVDDAFRQMRGGRK